MFSKFFIDRPVFAGVIAIVIVIAGLVASATLPVAQYPDIAPPTVIVNTSYPGASAETIAKTVAAPIEERLSGVEHLLYFNSSSSSTGDLTITATFDVGTNIDTAVFNVNNRVQLALPRLPDEVRRNGVIVQKRSNDILLLVALVSPDNSRDTLFLSNYATINLVDELKRVPGVADVGVFGARDYSMRIWLRPDRLAQLGLTVSDVAERLARAEQPVCGRQDRRRAGDQRPKPRLHRHCPRTAGRAGRVRRDRDSLGCRRRRAAPQGRGPRRARRAEL